MKTAAILPLLISLAVLVCGQHDGDDSTVVIADPSETGATNLAPGQPSHGYSREELEEVIKYYVAKHRPKTGEPIEMSLTPPDHLIGNPGKQASGILEAVEAVGAGIVGGMIGSQLTSGSQQPQQAPLYQGGYPYQGPAYYPPGAGYSPYPSAAGSYPYQSVYPSYYGSAGYYPGYLAPTAGQHHHQHYPNAIRNPSDAFGAINQPATFLDASSSAAAAEPQPLALKKKQQHQKWPVFPAGTGSFSYYAPDQEQQPYQPSYLPKDYYPKQAPESYGSFLDNQQDTLSPSAFGTLVPGSQTPHRPYGLLVNKRVYSQLSGGRYFGPRHPLVGYLSRPTHELPSTRDGMIDPQMAEQAAFRDGPFVFIYPEEKK